MADAGKGGAGAGEDQVAPLLAAGGGTFRWVYGAWRLPRAFEGKAAVGHLGVMFVAVAMLDGGRLLTPVLTVAAVWQLVCHAGSLMVAEQKGAPASMFL